MIMVILVVLKNSAIYAGPGNLDRFPHESVNLELVQTYLCWLQEYLKTE